MSASKTLAGLLAAGAVLAGSAASALAQPQGGAAYPGGTSPQGASGQQQSLAQVLHLTPGQMGAFQAFQHASQPTPDEISRLRAASPQVLGALSTPERLDRIGAALNARMEVFRRTADATRAFYGQLTPDQRQTFDRLSAPPSGQGRSRG